MIVNFEIGQLPDRIIYIANVDTELDLTGATLIPIQRDGYRCEEMLLQSLVYREQTPDWSTEIRHSIDFTTPGRYRVEIINRRPRYRARRLHFYVEVVDEETYNRLVAEDLDPSTEQND